jgi:hypothetical protein
LTGMTHSRAYSFLYRWWWVTFILLGVSFVLFGLLTLNLIHTLSAIFGFLSMYGTDAVRDGGLLQLAEVVASGYFAAACYLLFKLCEKVLVERLVADNKKGVDS